MTSTATQIKSLSDQLAVLKVQQAKELAGDKPDLPRLEDITTDYLDTIAKRLRTDTFEETAKTYHDAWQDHYYHLELSRLMFAGEHDLTVPQKMCDSQLRNFEYEMEQLVEYGDRVGHSIKEAVILEEISQLAYDDLTDKQAQLRSQWLNYYNMHHVLLHRVRPEIERRTGYTMGAYKSRDHLASEAKAKKWRPKNRRVNMETWLLMSKSEQDAYVKQHCTQL